MSDDNQPPKENTPFWWYFHHWAKEWFDRQPRRGYCKLPEPVDCVWREPAEEIPVGKYKIEIILTAEDIERLQKLNSRYQNPQDSTVSLSLLSFFQKKQKKKGGV